jgi:hypothetical protein
MFFTVLFVENGYQLRVNSGGKYLPVYLLSLEAFEKEILRVLTTEKTRNVVEKAKYSHRLLRP